MGKMRANTKILTTQSQMIILFIPFCVQSSWSGVVPPKSPPPPVVYAAARLEQDHAHTRTARKVSSHIAADLPDRIRKVSGVGYQ